MTVVDMEYLLLLQSLRDSAPHWLNEGILTYSEFIGGVGGLALMALVYWCMNKKAGTLLLMNFSLAYVCNGLVKNVFRVERPFLKDTRLTPYVSATGYSFPSGHTMLGTGVYGGLAVWQRSRKWLAGIFCLLALLTAFTRNWLGVHTPQDVVVGVLLSCGVIALNCFLLDWVDRGQGRDHILFLAGAALCLVYWVALPGSLKPAGIYAGVMLGWYLERRFIRFEVGGSLARKGMIFAVGMVLVGVCNKMLMPALTASLSSNLSGALTNFVTFLMITAGWPLVFKRLFS